MKDRWWCVMVFWKTGEVQSIWMKSEELALEIFNTIMEKEDWSKIRFFPEKEKEDEQG